jgi:hypothetical protein
MAIDSDWSDPEFPGRAPRGNGTNVHLTNGTVVFVQDNLREATNAWEDARRQAAHNRGTVARFNVAEGRHARIAPELIVRLEEL